jgi:hypothetical protein
MFRQPALGLAELSWRWSLGAAGIAPGIAAVLEYLDTLTVGPADIVFLRTRQPMLAERALTHIFRGSGPRAVAVFLILAVGFAIAWTVVAALGRAATLRAIFEHLRNEGFRNGRNSRGGCPDAGMGGVGALLGLNFLRVAITVAALVGLAGVLLLPGLRFHGKVLSPDSAALLILWMVFLLWVVWASLNWFLSLASVFVVGEGRDTFGAIRTAVDLCRSRGAAVLGVGAWFGLAHLGAFMAASSVVGMPLSMAGVAPAGVVLVLVCGVTLFYFAAVDFLYVGRLTAYAAITQWPEVQTAAATPALPPPEGPGRVDQDELILGDFPAPETGLLS